MAGLLLNRRRVGGTAALAVMLCAGLLALPSPAAAESPIQVAPGVYLTDAASVSSEPGSPQRARSRSLQPRIVGGNPIDISQAPWQAAVTLNPNIYVGNSFERQFCGGSLVSPTLIVSAAHCLFNPDNNAPIPPGDLAAVTGRTQLSGGGGQEIPLANYFHFTDANGNLLYDPRTSSWDVSVLQLSSPSSSTPIKVVGLDERELWAQGRSVQVSGWGTTSFQGPSSDILLAAELATLPDEYCSRSLPMDRATSQCAGVLSGIRDACQGDSGGPLVAPTRDGNARLVGNVQAGFECGRAQNPGLYGRFGADPLNTALRNAGMTIAGVDIVGAGAQAPTTLTPFQALELALILSDEECGRLKGCRFFDARKCKPRGTGFQCLLENLAKTRRLGKFTCERKAMFTAATGTIEHDLLGRRWGCSRGW